MEKWILDKGRWPGDLELETYRVGGAVSVKFIQGHALDVLSTLESNSIWCCVTSPPYFGLRDYKLKTQMWPDGWRGSLGLEPNPDLYIEHLVVVFREVRRVLREDGTCWLNMGDSYAGSWGNQGRKPERGGQREVNGPMIQNLEPYPDASTKTGSWVSEHPTLKPKDLCLIPFRLAIALQEDGWYVRSDIIWSKRNPLPESVRDRPSKSHEYLFLLTRSSKYYFDQEAVREPISPANIPRTKRADLRLKDGYAEAHFGNPPVKSSSQNSMGEKWANQDGRNIRSVWTIATQSFPDAHFAVFPEKLVEPCIKAGCPVGGTTLDPFAGAGTVSLVSAKLGRSHIGIELNPNYIAMAERRLKQYAPLFL